MKKFFLLFTPPDEQNIVAEEKRALYSALYASLLYTPLTMAFNLAGFGIIYILSLLGMLDQVSNRLMLFPVILLIVAVVQFPLIRILDEKRVVSVGVVFVIIGSLSMATQVLFWSGLAAFIAIISLLVPISFLLLRGPSASIKFIIVLYAIALVASIFQLDRTLTIERVNASSLAGMASSTVYITVLLTLIILIVSTTATPFRTIVARLVTTFAFITTLSAVTTLLIGALNSFFYDRRNTFEQIRTITNLKSEQIRSVLTDLESDASNALNDPIIAQRILYLLRNRPGSILYEYNYDIVKAYLSKVQSQSERYDELLLVNGTGQVILSTNRLNENMNFSNQAFFQGAMDNLNYVIDDKFPGAVGSSIVFVRPISSEDFLLGAFAAVSNFDVISRIVETKTDPNATLETYLVSSTLKPLTKTLTEVDAIRTDATSQIITFRYDEGQGIYQNYQGTTVVGYYTWIPKLQAALITEISQTEVFQDTLQILLTNLSVGFFTTLMAFAIVLVTSRSISAPVITLAEKANALASGDFGVRIAVSRNDEIGSMASAFNKMAEELQNLVQNLEQNVDERTKDIQKQASRLRLAAEVARDATTSDNLDALLNRSAQILQERFGFYYTGIFLIDSTREYAVLRSSPTEAGKSLLERGYRIPLGKAGIISNVATTGESRIALDTDKDAVFIRNPLLPSTRSEITTPLKVNNVVIGVLDVQSDQPGAFSQEDISVLQIVADQLALAIQRAQLVEQLASNVQEVERAYQQMTLSTWEAVSMSRTTNGYQYDGISVTPLKSFSETNQEALSRGRTITYEEQVDADFAKSQVMATPVKLRNQVIGALTIKFATEKIPQETISLVEETANRLALALENARLYAETQKRAERDRLLGEISARIGSSFNIDNILRYTTEEFGKILPEADIVIEIEKYKED
jgi:GAF domain-containing protein/HAMP domain-containing protein